MRRLDQRTGLNLTRCLSLEDDLAQLCRAPEQQSGGILLL